MRIFRIESMLNVPITTSLEDDEMIKQMNENIRFYEK